MSFNSWLKSLSSDFRDQEKKNLPLFPFFPHLCAPHEVRGHDAMILVF